MHDGVRGKFGDDVLRRLGRQPPVGELRTATLIATDGWDLDLSLWTDAAECGPWMIRAVSIPHTRGRKLS